MIDATLPNEGEISQQVHVMVSASELQALEKIHQKLHLHIFSLFMDVRAVAAKQLSE